MNDTNKEQDGPGVPSERKVWRGAYRDICWEINKMPSDGISDFHNGRWTFYLWIYLDQIPEEFHDELWLTPYEVDDKGRAFYRYDTPLIDSIEWHCGCTWYSKEHGHDGSYRVVKIGCDYQHAWDVGQFYNEQIVYQDVRIAIDSLHRAAPGIKARCGYCGRWEDPEKLIGEHRYHAACKRKQDAWRADFVAKKAASV